MPTQRPLTVYLVRHGETQWNREGRCQGVTDIPLTEKGIQQAEALGRGFATKRPSLILASPLQRAHETAIRIAQPHGLAIETSTALQEWDQGDLEGLTGA
jgi:broad specificity phosphatase PhoE